MNLVLKNISAAYSANKSIIDSLSVSTQPGEFIGLVGPNGAGKSCLIKTIAGLLKPQNGTLSIMGKGAQPLISKDRAKHIAYLAQDRHAVWPLPARDLIALGRAPYRGGLGKLNADDVAAIDTAIENAQCSSLQHRRFDSLSGGEQARIHLARALAVDAPILLADEPIAALDPYYQISIMQALKAQTNAGKTILASLHDLTLAKQFCTRIWVLHEGKLAVDAAPHTALGADTLAQVFGIKQDGLNVSLIGA